MNAPRRIRVLIVDDSAIAREFLESGLSRDPGIEITGKASDAFSARDKIVLLNPDVVTLDVEMPGMDGIDFLKRLISQYPIPVIVVSAITVEGSKRALDALEAGAIDVVAKPDARNADGLKNMLGELIDKIKAASCADVQKLRRSPIKPRTAFRHGNRTSDDRHLIVIGASTGGTNVLNDIIPQFPPDFPGTVIVQHMPPVFTRLFAEALDRNSRVKVVEAKDGDIVRRGCVYIAPGNFQCTLVTSGETWKIRCEDGDKVSGHRPSVDVLFGSAAKFAGARAIGVLLTGMGRDGAEGLLAMRQAGARCFAQDEQSSVVFGMPKEAWENGAAERLVPAELVTGTILACLDTDTGNRSTQ